MFLDVCLPPHAGPWFCIPIGCAGSRVHAAGSDQGSRQANLQLQLEHFPLLIFQVQQLAIVALRRRRFQMLKKMPSILKKKQKRNKKKKASQESGPMARRSSHGNGSCPHHTRCMLCGRPRAVAYEELLSTLLSRP